MDSSHMFAPSDEELQRLALDDEALTAKKTELESVFSTFSSATTFSSSIYQNKV